MRLVPAVLALALLALTASPAVAQQAFTPDYEAATFAKTQERFVHLVSTPQYQALLREKGAEREADLAEIYAGDGERDMSGNLCEQRMDGCAGDVRFYDWVAEEGGLALPVLWTARNGSTISGHVWATADGPARRPGVVITTGSVQAPEELYWFMATTLAKAGYVVLTWDVQGQGYSDTYGEGADRQDGVPSQSGRPFYDQTEDALDFFFSTPTELYGPRTSCTSGTSHAEKQQRRFAAGLVSGYNPLWSLLDTARVGSVGQSLGAGAVSYIGQLDPRVKAVAALDNLREPTGAPACDSGSSPRPAEVTPRVPALGIAGDYGLVVTPNTQQPQADAKTVASKALSAAGVDTAEVVIRGGTHYEMDFIPNPAFGATLRGMDMTAWYVRAWMDRYVKGDRGAKADLLTDRWRADARNAEVDQLGDPNMFSGYHRSRFDVDDVVCEQARDMCPELAPDTRGTEAYDALADAYRKDTADGPGRAAAAPWVISTSPAGAMGVPPAANRVLPPPAAPAPATGPSTTPGAGAPAPVAGTPTPAAGTPAPTGTTPPPAASSTPAPAPAATTRCRDTAAPRSRPVALRGRVLRGTATDTGCTAGGRLVRVRVAVGRTLAGGRCAWLRPDGRLGRPGSCTRVPYVDATGTTSWSLRLPRSLPRGAYKVWTRGTDAAGNVERKSSTRNFRRTVVR